MVLSSWVAGAAQICPFRPAQDRLHRSGSYLTGPKTFLVGRLRRVSWCASATSSLHHILSQPSLQIFLDLPSWFLRFINANMVVWAHDFFKSLLFFLDERFNSHGLELAATSSSSNRSRSWILFYFFFLIQDLTSIDCIAQSHVSHIIKNIF